MNRAVDLLRRAESSMRGHCSAMMKVSERDLLLGTVLVMTAISGLLAFILGQYFSIDVFSSLLFVPQDCFVDMGMNVGRHCFSDYPWVMRMAMRPNPWESYPVFLPPLYQPFQNNYTAAATLPHVVFGLLGQWLGSPRLGLFAYLTALTVAVFTPAVWAARGARGLERLVVFLACGVAAIPAWVAIDRGNSVGFVVPIALVFLVALCRRRWGLAAAMVVLAALVKPQFAIIVFALFAARQWRMGVAAVAGGLGANLAAYLLWPRDFPGTVMQSIHNLIGFGSAGKSTMGDNVSFGKMLLMIPDAIKAHQTGGEIPASYLAAPRFLIGYVILFVSIVSVLALGRRIPPVMVGILLLSISSLFPALSGRYYLLFAVPVAALLVRNPDGPAELGIFGGSTFGDRRRAVGICVSLASALSIAQIALPSQTIHADIVEQNAAPHVFSRILGSTPVVVSTASWASVCWLIACGVIIVSYARRPYVSRQLKTSFTLAPDDSRREDPCEPLSCGPREIAEPVSATVKVPAKAGIS